MYKFLTKLNRTQPTTKCKYYITEKHYQVTKSMPHWCVANAKYLKIAWNIKAKVMKNIMNNMQKDRYNRPMTFMDTFKMHKIYLALKRTKKKNRARIFSQKKQKEYTQNF